MTQQPQNGKITATQDNVLALLQNEKLAKLLQNNDVLALLDITAQSIDLGYVNDVRWSILNSFYFLRIRNPEARVGKIFEATLPESVQKQLDALKT